MAISLSNINQFSKERTFLKSEFCGLHKNDQHFYPRCFGSREMAKKQSVQSNSGHPVMVETHWVWDNSENMLGIGLCTHMLCIRYGW